MKRQHGTAIDICIDKIVDAIVSRKLNADTEEGISVNAVAEFLKIGRPQAETICDKLTDLLKAYRGETQ